jgi:maleylacetate reductase
MSWTHTSLAQRVVSGAGLLDSVPTLLRDIGGRRVLLVSTSGRLASEAGERLVARLGRAVSAVFDGAREHVPAPTVQAALGIARDRDADVVVSFGGGSVVDLAKAVCFFVEQEAGTPGSSFVDRPVLPHLAIPTTDTAAPYTASFGITDPNSRRRTTAGGPTVAPLVVMRDVELIAAVDADRARWSVLTALGHAVDALSSPAATPESSASARAALRSPADAAVLAGRAMGVTGAGLHHGLAELVAARCGVPYVLAGAALVGQVAAEVGIDLAAVELPQLDISLEDAAAVARMAEASPHVRASGRKVDVEEMLASVM